jgi:putative ABC transport system ATP-binding protein
VSIRGASQVKKTEAIVCQNVVKIYQSGEVKTLALRGLELQVSRGEFRAIIGPSGSGKTSLLNLIAGVDAPTAGRILVNGEEISSYSPDILAEYRRRSIGMVFQFFNLVPYLTSLENIELPMQFAGLRGDSHQKAQKLLKLTGVAEKAHARPAQLSGGEQQRVAIAVALANDPPILLADEPTAELDTLNAYNITRLFRSLNRRLRKTIVIVTHDPKIAASADRVSLLEDGLITQTLAPEELTRQRTAPRPGAQNRIEELLKERHSIESRIQKLEQDFKQSRIPPLDFSQTYQRLHKRLTEIQNALQRHT